MQQHHESKPLTFKDNHSSNIYYLGLLPNKNIISAADSKIKIWDIKTRKCLKTLETGSGRCIAFLTNGNMLVDFKNVESIQELNIETGKCITGFVAPTEGYLFPTLPNGAALLSKGYLIGGSADNCLLLMNINTGELESLPGHRTPITSFAVLPNGNLITGAWDKSINVWDITKKQCVKTLEAENAVNHIEILPGGLVLSVGRDFNNE